MSAVHTHSSSCFAWRAHHTVGSSWTLKINQRPVRSASYNCDLTDMSWKGSLKTQYRSNNNKVINNFTHSCCYLPEDRGLQALPSNQYFLDFPERDSIVSVPFYWWRCHIHLENRPIIMIQMKGSIPGVQGVRWIPLVQEAPSEPSTENMTAAYSSDSGRNSVCILIYVPWMRSSS